MHSINRYLQQADTLRFKLLGIVGKEPRKKDKIIAYLKKKRLDRRGCGKRAAAQKIGN